MRGRPVGGEEALAALTVAARSSINPSLLTITRLAAALGDPQRALRVVQVAGTNGKGSTTRMVESLLRAHGERAGAFTSPLLHDLTDHVLVDGERVTREALGGGAASALEAAAWLGDDLPSPPTQFELLTAAALCVLRDAGVTWAVLEVGMGGRWDSTSVATPDVAVVTSVGLDHMEFLGPTLGHIARDKAHVIRAGGVGVLGPGTAEVDPVFAERAAEVGARLVRVLPTAAGDRGPMGADEARFHVTRAIDAPDGTTVLDYVGPAGEHDGLGVPGPGYQADNAACALTATALALGRPLDSALTARALAQSAMPGRFEVLARAPWLVVDVAHNPAGARVLADAVERAFGGRRVTVVLGVLADKDAGAVAEALAPVATRFVVVRPESPRARDAADLAALVQEATGCVPHIAPSVGSAIAEVRAAGEECVVTGSVVTVAEARVACGAPGAGADGG